MFSAPKRLVFGGDPGQGSGAMVLLRSHRRVMAWWTWLEMARKNGPNVIRLTSSLGLRRATFDTVGQAVATIPESLVYEYPFELSLEAVFANRKNPQSVIPLAESRGQIISSMGQAPNHSPYATQWRPRQLNIRGNAEATYAEGVAKRLAPLTFEWPTDVDPPTTVVELGALAEAAFIARDGWIQGADKARLAGR